MIKWPIKNGQNSWTDIMNYPGKVSIWVVRSGIYIYVCICVYIYICEGIQLIVKIMGEILKEICRENKRENQKGLVSWKLNEVFQGENGQ